MMKKLALHFKVLLKSWEIHRINRKRDKALRKIGELTIRYIEGKYIDGEWYGNDFSEFQHLDEQIREKREVLKEQVRKMEI